MAEENQKSILPQEPQQTVPAEKTSWPELVGQTAEDAEKKIKEDMPRAKVHKVPQGSMVTADFRTDRVRIYTDASGKVAKPPRIG